MYNRYFKSIIDFLSSFIGLLIISPVFILVMIINSVHLKGNPFFLQSRPGKNNKIFRLVKFKTMNDSRDSEGNLLPDAERLTPVGRIIRNTSLDELPQLINVLKGDMSLVGPRPLLVKYLPLYSPYHQRRHEVRPGITGLAQVYGRNNMKFSDRFNLDVWYVDNHSLLLDLKILLLTIQNVLLAKGVKNGQDVTEVDDLNFNKQ